MLIDSHAHIYSKKFSNDLNEIVDRAKENDISRIYMPNIDRTSIEPMLETENKFPELCSSMMGLHPCSVNKDFEKELYIIEEWLPKKKWAAVGEIGLDLYWDKSTLDYQLEALRIQVEWARHYELPIVIHCREAFEPIFDFFQNIDTKGLKVVFHCFTGGLQDLEKLDELDFYVGIGGVLTFKNGGIAEIISNAKRDRLLIETDSPYLAPVPHRGKRNEPSYVDLIADKLSTVLDLSKAEIADLTTKNALNFFAL